MEYISIAALMAAAYSPVPFACAAASAPQEGPTERDAAAALKWKERLGLSAEQLPKFLSALKAREAEVGPLREQLRSFMVKLQAQVTQGAAEDEVRDTLSQCARLRKIIALRGEQFDAGLESFLEPTQRAKLAVWRSLGDSRAQPAHEDDADGFRAPAPADEAEPE